MGKKSKALFKSNTAKIKEIKNSRYGKKLTNSEIKNTGIDKSLKTVRKKQRKHDKQVERHNIKKEFLKKNYIDVDNVRYKDIEKIKMDDVRTGHFNLEKYPMYKNNSAVDMYRKMKFPEGVRLYVAYMDYTCENNLSELIKLYNGYQPSELLRILRELVNKPMTAILRVAGTSSGKAGTAIFRISTNMELMDEYVTVAAANKHYNSKKYKKSNKIKRHKGDYRGYQRWITSDGRATHTSVSAYDLTLMMVVLMDNVREYERSGLYQNFYESIEELGMSDNTDENWYKYLKILPKPNYDKF